MIKGILRGLSIVLLGMTAGHQTLAQESAPWYRRARLEGAYDLRGTRILVVAGADFNYQETVEMADCWKRWGALIEFAGPTRTLTAEQERVAGGPPAAPATLRVDRLLSEADPSRYDVLYLAGGEGVRQLVADHGRELATLIEGVHGRGRVVSAICHGPMALATSGLVKGKRVTVQGTTERKMLEQAGAEVVNDIAVVDGRLVTGQWPHLEEFAVTLAESVQYPRGGGPREKALAARSSIERAVDDLRDTYTFEPRPVRAEALEVLMRAGQRALAARGTRGARSMRFVAVREVATKAELSGRLYEKAKTAFTAMGIPEAAARTQIGAFIEGAPVVLFQFIDAPPVPASDLREGTVRADTAFAGAAGANIALVARSLGLGVSAIGMQPFLEAEADVRQILKVPDTQVLVGMYGIGYPAASGTPAVARPASDLLALERWGAGGAADTRR